ncbi:hypothetical protein ABL78_5248 [Leptomonas seymouri]|uniref:Uncharacterized protein n=1 Tax=Leptomonas seymouri TaxID=5684 RepID=A0A0N0P4U8_LEPSE|nr:hypothetical protein ABL78_5248 [Leptomonas seymouri]|eukprot:KPI85716.1 hypothetical protein ABL78_5248 [Leptomonas seymouri]
MSNSHVVGAAAEANGGKDMVRVAMPRELQIRRSQKRGISPEAVRNHEAAEANVLIAAAPAAATAQVGAMEGAPADTATPPSGSRIFMKMPAEVRRKRSQSRETSHNGLLYRREEPETFRPTVNTAPVAVAQAPAAQVRHQPEPQSQLETSAQPSPMTEAAAVEELEKKAEEPREAHVAATEVKDHVHEEAANIEERAEIAQKEAVVAEEAAVKKAGDAKRAAENGEAVALERAETAQKDAVGAGEAVVKKAETKAEAKQAVKNDAKKKEKSQGACCSTM